MDDYIGIDISKSSLDVYDGKKSYKFPNNHDGFEKIVALCSDIHNTVFIFEPTGIYSYALTEFCATNAIRIVMVGPKESREFARSLKVRSKTDKIDAKVLYKYQSHIEQGMAQVPVVNTNAVQLQEMLNVYEGIQASKQRFKNQREAVSDKSSELIRTLNGIIENLDKEASMLLDKIEAILLDDDETKQRYDAMTSIPSVGKKSALYLLVFFMKYPMANAKKITALAGLDPVVRDSGIFQGRQKISKQGGEQLRNLLYLPTLSAIQHNERIKVFYSRLVSNAKTRKLAVLAAMRKLVLMAFSLYRSKESYKPLSIAN